MTKLQIVLIVIVAIGLSFLITPFMVGAIFLGYAGYKFLKQVCSNDPNNREFEDWWDKFSFDHYRKTDDKQSTL